MGVLGGLGGALIGGLIANEEQQDQLESERDAAREALRQEAYAGYLAAANTLFLTGQIADRDAALDQDEVSEEEVTSASMLHSKPKRQLRSSHLLNSGRRRGS